MSNTFWNELFWLLSIDSDSTDSQRLKELANVRKTQRGEVIAHQFHPAKFLYFLIRGRVKLSVEIEGEMGEFNVGTVDKPFFPLGWSGVSQPYRYTIV